MEHTNYKIKKIKFFYLLVMLQSSITIANAQQSMKVIEKSKNILRVFSSFDSVVLIKAESFWKEDKSFYGLGFKNKDVYYLTGYFKYKKKIPNGAKLNRQKKIDLNSTSVDLKKIQSLNGDSLNNFIDYTSGKKLIVSDGVLYSLITIDNIEIMVKESYKVRSYQSISPNSEREYFLEIFQVFEDICHCTLIKD